MTKTYESARDAAADAYSHSDVFRKNLSDLARSEHADSFKAGADWANERARAEVEHLNRQLADERSGDCDKDKTIRRLQGNNDHLTRENAELREKLEKAEATLKRHPITYGDVMKLIAEECDETGLIKERDAARAVAEKLAGAIREFEEAGTLRFADQDKTPAWKERWETARMDLTLALAEYEAFKKRGSE